MTQVNITLTSMFQDLTSIFKNVKTKHVILEIIDSDDTQLVCQFSDEESIYKYIRSELKEFLRDKPSFFVNYDKGEFIIYCNRVERVYTIHGYDNKKLKEFFSQDILLNEKFECINPHLNEYKCK